MRRNNHSVRQAFIENLPNPPKKTQKKKKKKKKPAFIGRSLFSVLSVKGK